MLQRRLLATAATRTTSQKHCCRVFRARFLIGDTSCLVSQPRVSQHSICFKSEDFAYALWSRFIGSLIVIQCEGSLLWYELVSAWPAIRRRNTTQSTHHLLPGNTFQATKASSFDPLFAINESLAYSPKSHRNLTGKAGPLQLYFTAVVYRVGNCQHDTLFYE